MKGQHRTGQDRKGKGNERTVWQETESQGPDWSRQEKREGKIMIFMQVAAIEASLALIWSPFNQPRTFHANGIDPSPQVERKQRRDNKDKGKNMKGHLSA